MTLIEFDTLKLGIEEIDTEHWEMFNILDVVLEKVRHNDYDGVNNALDTMLHDFTNHADREILIMQNMNFPFIGTHIVAHSILLAMLEREIKNALRSDYQNLTDGVESILIDHILQYDVLYAEYAKHIAPQLESQ